MCSASYCAYPKPDFLMHKQPALHGSLVQSHESVGVMARPHGSPHQYVACACIISYESFTMWFGVCGLGMFLGQHYNNFWGRINKRSPIVAL